MMNCILIVDSAVHSGGISTVLLAHAQGLKARGWSVHLFAVDGPVDTELAHYLDSYETLFDAPRNRSRISEIWNRESAKRLTNFLNGFSDKPAIAHVHSLSMALSPSISIAFKKTQMPYVITAHDAGWACPTGYLYNFQTNEPCKLRPLSLQCFASNCDKRSYFHKLFKLIKSISLDYVSGLKKNAGLIYAPSDSLKDIISSRVPKSVPIQVLMNPLKLENNGHRTKPGKHFVFVGRLWEEKGIVKLLEAIGNQYPLVVVGDGGLKNELIKKYPNVTFLGKLHPSKIYEVLQDSKALILPSIYAEAFGLVVPEALSQGVPVIVSSSAGSTSMVKNGVNGYIVDMAKLGELTEACELLMDENRNAAMSKNAYEMYWQRPLSIEQYIEEIDPTYQKLLKK